ncbi:MdtA/MuxA family multidrug efflux RND transporter periplasmic adaptor subunit [Pseudomonas sp. Marseille-Q5115]|uniref:MdtA/MuxA family multidrug efflux RND transporter periplasmic adaptor subunit n=1 Tax=Pseudomonas sp. Marseille-Q5115 TaxID=2866593 RepID=UPI001CE44CB3|nr:MdtA/MuxA family multidrug efflux RND transporter periplasmic adaptor subunit [Pseudomonas sp. Marseille-Q5115]
MLANSIFPAHLHAIICPYSISSEQQMVQHSRRTLRTLFAVAAVLAVAFAALGVWHSLKQGHGGGGAPGAGVKPLMGAPGAAMGGGVTVAVGQARQQDVPVYQQALGTVIANASVTVTSRVDGQLQAVYFSEGQKVKKGQLLAQIDPRAYQATLDQYQGELAENRALLKSAQLTLARYQRLFDKDSLARQDLDTQTATVGQYQGTVQADQAQIAAARLNLEYARIVSPIDGYVGLRLVDPGNMVHASDTTGIVTVTQTDPIAVTFSLPQAQLATLLPKLRKGEKLPVQALDAQQNSEIASGELKFISNEIDTATGSIKLKAQFANPNDALYPNQFVNVKVQTDVLAKAVTVPSAAVQLGASGNFIYVVKADGSIERRSVTTGPVVDDRTAILTGMQADERVVTRGIDHLRDGIKVTVEQSTEVASGGAGQ